MRKNLKNEMQKKFKQKYEENNYIKLNLLNGI